MSFQLWKVKLVKEKKSKTKESNLKQKHRTWAQPHPTGNEHTGFCYCCSLF